jgi:crotonobetainyl-CoA:carnitine CoA-transferase CaiB-like acyl-CoA transferase
LLADLGAECSRLRWTDERPGDWPDDSLFRAYFAEGVEEVTRLLPLPELLETVESLSPSFDLVVTDYNQPEVQAGELGRRLRRFNPSLVIANADHFGRTGPYATWVGDELTDYAMGGYWAIAGDPGQPPLRVPGFQAQFHGGAHLTLASLAALRHARLTGEGQEVEVSSLEAMLGAHWSTTVAWTHEGRVLKREGSDLFRANDGWVFFYRLGMYTNLFLLMERPELLDDPRFGSIAGWLENAEALWSMVAEWCRDKSVDEIVSSAQELRIPVTPMTTAETLLADPVLEERRFFRDIAGARLPGRPYRWTDSWQLGSATSRLKTLLERTPTVHPVGPFSSTLTGSRLGGAALAGIRILELTNNWAGPVAGRHLADLGAEVIKVELAAKPATRASHYPGKEPGKYHWNRSGYFNEMNRNKRDVSLNLATSRGRELFLRLVQQADALVENNSARVMPNLGLGYPELAAVNPRLVMASISGFGATGARRDWVAFGSNIEAACGLAAITGYANGVPQRTGSFVADPIAGAHAAIAILAGLERRDRTGIGAHIDIALTESAMPFMLRAFSHFQSTGHLLPRSGSGDPDDAPSGAYRCAGSDDWVAIAVRTDVQWASVARLAAVDPSLGLTRQLRVQNRTRIDSQLSQWTGALEQYECCHLLQSCGIPAAPILHNWQLHCDPHLFARNAFIPIEHPDTGVLPYPGFPWYLEATPASLRSAAPRFAEGNDYVFRALLGLGDSEVAELYTDGTTASVPIGMVAISVR